MNKLKIIIEKLKAKKMLFLYYLSILTVILYFTGQVTIITDKINLFGYVDIPTLFGVGCLPFAIMFILYGMTNTMNMFLLPLKKNPPEDILNEALWFFKLYNKIIWYSSLMFLMINVIEILIKLNGLSMLSIDYNIILALSVLSLLYAVLLNLIIIIPYTIIIKRQLKQYDKKNDNI